MYSDPVFRTPFSFSVPEHADTVLAWGHELGKAGLNKLMWDNAARFFRLLSTPWDNAKAS